MGLSEKEKLKIAKLREKRDSARVPYDMFKMVIILGLSVIICAYMESKPSLEGYVPLFMIIPVVLCYATLGFLN